MEASLQQPISDRVLQLLLFVDKRPSSNERIRQIRTSLKDLAKNADAYELQVIDVSEQPHLAEHFKLMATPSLIKIHPQPRQVLAGTNLIAQIETWWPRWQLAVEEYQAAPQLQSANGDSKPQIQSVAQSAEFLRLSDEVFKLQREQAELQAQLQFKDQLIAILAHDLRNPLTTLSIALETLEMGMTREVKHPRMTPELLNQMLRQARTQAKALDRMITDILQVARERGAELRIQPQELDLAELCLEVIARLQEQFQAKSQQIQTDFPSDLPCVYADPDRIRQVLVNLLDNACKYTPADGKIMLAILHRTTQKVQVSIGDTGPGVPLENQGRIFDDRFRLQRDQAQDGYGIGLALCKRIVQAHFGQIWVDSEVEQGKGGSCFHFTLPVYRPLQPLRN
ncbi:MAG: histidine kinase [Pegethrix bostrychoides GSE-TBD4-15B]|jgi:two-component system clock-associated histidine kinase SasA|uniref:Adaptive-response sensory-kinase SasA n=1 Tax=Pegethrix bostrychoides GSE-TBD4-15B TaxID=2839662 RepID=A0A951P9A4_9CYAN|nr:histidine kinase [Pegethrix bostrychoides GSE-TBD4-15B]